MLNIKVSRIATYIALGLIAGCAHQAVDTGSSASQASIADSNSVKIDPSNAKDIITLGKRLTQNRLSLYSGSHGKYTFYVGGVLIATYETATGIFSISSLTSQDKTEYTCEYSPQGTLVVDPKNQSDKDSSGKDCNGLADKLNDYMNN